MQGKEYLVVASIVLIGILIGSVAVVYVLLPERSKQVVPIASIPPREVPKPEVHLYKRAGGLVLAWNHLPEGTERIVIYRTKRGEEKWAKWKTVTLDISRLDGGSIDIATKDNLNNYFFYAEAVKTNAKASSTAAGSGGGAGSGTGSDIVLWTSQGTPTPIETPPAPPSSAPTSSAPSAPAPTSTTAPQNQTQSPASSSTQPQQSGSSGSGTAGPSYYTPSGQISGAAITQTEQFWVAHVNRSIEIGWQNIPATSTLVVVYRSTSEGGPWTELLRQNEPPLSYSIRLVDNTITTPHYYRMEARAGMVVLKSYGPAYLPALE